MLAVTWCPRSQVDSSQLLPLCFVSQFYTVSARCQVCFGDNRRCRGHCITLSARLCWGCLPACMYCMFGGGQPVVRCRGSCCLGQPPQILLPGCGTTGVVLMQLRVIAAVAATVSQLPAQTFLCSKLLTRLLVVRNPGNLHTPSPDCVERRAGDEVQPCWAPIW